LAGKKTALNNTEVRGGRGTNLDNLNSADKYDFNNVVDAYLLNDDNFMPNLDHNINSKFEDFSTLKTKFSKTNIPLFLSLNVQCLSSKYENLKNSILDLINHKVPILAVALQETWACPVPSDLTIPGFSLFLNNRKNCKGGGVGFYIKENLNAKQIKDLTLMNEKIFESIGLEFTLNGKKLILTNYYRSPNHPANTTALQARTDFIDILSNFLSKLNELRYTSYVFSDSNINLLKLPYDNFVDDYYSSLLLNGFTQAIYRATRIQGQSYGLIDHIATNNPSNDLISGVVIDDISDHFLTFILHDSPLRPNPDEFLFKRNFNLTNIGRFKQALANENWNDVTEDNYVDTSYEKFWSKFSLHYDAIFPLQKVKRNINIHKINNFMTQGLLVSRITKNNLHKASIANPSDINLYLFKSYRNLYNKLIRKSKNLYFETELNTNKKNPKKTWEIIGQALNKQKGGDSIPEIIDDDKILTDNTCKADAFNRFFTEIGRKINQSIPDTIKTPDTFLTDMPEAPNFDIGNIGPIYVSDIIKSLPNKSSNDPMV